MYFKAWFVFMCLCVFFIILFKLFASLCSSLYLSVLSLSLSLSLCSLSLCVCTLQCPRQMRMIMSNLNISRSNTFLCRSLVSQRLFRCSSLWFSLSTCISFFLEVSIQSHRFPNFLKPWPLDKMYYPEASFL
jgi:hypothetical protein